MSQLQMILLYLKRFVFDCDSNIQRIKEDIQSSGVEKTTAIETTPAVSPSNGESLPSNESPSKSNMTKVAEVKKENTEEKAPAPIEEVNTEEKSNEDKETSKPFVVTFDSEGWSDSSSSSESSSSSSSSESKPDNNQKDEKDIKLNEKKLDNTTAFSESDGDSVSKEEQKVQIATPEPATSTEPETKMIEKVTSSLSEESESSSESSESSSDDSSDSSSSSSDNSEEVTREDKKKPKVDAQSSLKSLLRGSIHLIP